MGYFTDAACMDKKGEMTVARVILGAQCNITWPKAVAGDLSRCFAFEGTDAGGRPVKVFAYAESASEAARWINAVATNI
jgi:hypothetical protein